AHSQDVNVVHDGYRYRDLASAQHALFFFFFFQAEDGIRDFHVTGVQTCALPISPSPPTRCGRATGRRRAARRGRRRTGAACPARSEERRVGKECRSGGSANQENKKEGQERTSRERGEETVRRGEGCQEHGAVVTR